MRISFPFFHLGKTKGNTGLISLLPSPRNKGKSGSYFLSSISGKQREITVVFPGKSVFFCCVVFLLFGLFGCLFFCCLGGGVFLFWLFGRGVVFFRRLGGGMCLFCCFGGGAFIFFAIWAGGVFVLSKKTRVPLFPFFQFRQAREVRILFPSFHLLKTKGNKGHIFLLPSPESKRKNESYFPSSFSGKQRATRISFPFFHLRTATGNESLISFFPSPVEIMRERAVTHKTSQTSCESAP